MKQKILPVVGSAVLLSALLVASAPITSATVAHGAHVVPLRPEVVQEGKARGEPSPELQFPKGLNKGARFAAPDGTPLGTLEVPDSLKALVILVEFSDTEGEYAQSVFDELLFSENYDPAGNEVELPDGTVIHGPTDRTLRNYFDEVSYGAVTVEGTVVDWVQVDEPYSYYCNADFPNWWGFGEYPNNVQGLVRDAVMAADPDVNFAEFAADGVVQNLFIVHTGSGAEWTGQVDVIWSHSWDMSEDDWGNQVDEVVVDGVKIMDYSMEPEYGGIPDGPNGSVSDPFPPTVGVYAHEFLHVLGIPDEYDYGYESAGTGDWSGMASGSWNFWPSAPSPYYGRFLGNSPAHPTAWAKIRVGFVEPVVVPAEGLEEQVIPPVEEEPVIYKIEVPFASGTEYFLAENRQQIGFDQGLVGYMGPNAHGLLIYQIDENVLAASYWRPNEAECWRMNNANCTKVNPANGQTHYGISLEQADGRFEMEKYRSYGDSADPFPGILGNHTFGATSTPNSSSFYFWSGPSPVPGTSAVLVDDIQEEDGVITADFGYQGQGN